MKISPMKTLALILLLFAVFILTGCKTEFPQVEMAKHMQYDFLTDLMIYGDSLAFDDVDEFVVVMCGPKDQDICEHAWAIAHDKSYDAWRLEAAAVRYQERSTR